MTRVVGKLLLAGGMVAAGESFLQRIRQHIQKLAFPVPAEKTVVCYARLVISAERTPRVRVGLETRRIGRRHVDANAVPLIKDERGAPQIHDQFVRVARFEE